MNSRLYELYKQHPIITTDSRNCPEGSIFMALKGASFDGNKFAQTALDKGCAYAVIDNPDYDKADGRHILVPDALVAYKELAREHRRQFDIPVIGITGTNGKTTTKELVSAVLAERYRVMHTEANYNNDVGVPKTLLRLAPEHQIAVVEMGASHPGDIKRLVDYVEPTCGLITNVGRAHLQGFGSFEGVMRTKGELYDYLRAHDGLTFVDAANPYLTKMVAERRLAPTETYSADAAKPAEVVGRVVSSAPFLCFEWQVRGQSTSHRVQSHIIGTYNITNMLAAIAVGLHFGVEASQISHALEAYVPSNNRSQLTVTAQNRLIVDAYNANPTSMRAALDNFAYMQVPHKMAILGDMRELGEASAEEHQHVVDHIAELGLTDVWLVGSEFAKTRCAYRKFADVEEVKEALAQHQPTDHYILIKGSNGIRLYELPALL